MKMQVTILTAACIGTLDWLSVRQSGMSNVFDDIYIQSEREKEKAGERRRERGREREERERERERKPLSPEP
jgi:hypothetical protein